MNVIHVPRPSPKAMNPDRPANALILAQVSHLQQAESRLPLRYRSEIYIHAIKTEGEAAEVHSRSDRGNSSGPCRRCEAMGKTRTQARAGNCRCRGTAETEGQNEKQQAGKEVEEILVAMRMQWRVALLVLSACTMAWPQESKLHAELRGEETRVSEACSSFSFNCPYALVYRSPTSHRGWEYASAKWVWTGRGIRLVEEYPELADELGLRCGRRHQRCVAARAAT